MKKVYNTPWMHCESFVANQYIAACTLTITKDKLDGMNCVNPRHKKSSYHTVAARVENVFTDKSTNCVTLIKSGSPYTASKNGYTPSNGATVYGFTLNGNTPQEKKYTYYTNASDNTNDCFGSFINSTSSETTVVPFS